MLSVWYRLQVEVHPIVWLRQERDSTWSLCQLRVTLWWAYGQHVLSAYCVLWATCWEKDWKQPLCSQHSWPSWEDKPETSFYSELMYKRRKLRAVLWSNFVLWKVLWASLNLRLFLWSTGIQTPPLPRVLGVCKWALICLSVCTARCCTEHCYILSNKPIYGDQGREPAFLEEAGAARSPQLGQRGSSLWVVSLQGNA